MMLMGVLNVTPDSFYDGGTWDTKHDAVRHGIDMFANGAAIVDVGGESTRPGAMAVDEQEELRRVVPIVEALASHGRVSIDTRKAVVARAAVAAGASIINDVSCSLYDIAGETGVGYVAMHMHGDPQTMQSDPRYRDVVSEVGEHLAKAAERARSAGVTECWIDPGIGFGKGLEHNLALLRALPALRGIAPVLLGVSRKSVLGEITGRRDPAERLSASLAIAYLAAELGVDVLRVHDISETRDVLIVRDTVLGET